MPRQPTTPKAPAKKPRRPRTTKPKETTAIAVVPNPYPALPRQKASASFQAFRDSFFSPAFETEQEPMDRLLKKYGQGSTWTYIAVNRIANAAAQIPLQVFDRTRAGRPDALVKNRDGGLLDLLDRPNPWQSRYDFVESAFVSLELTGNLFVELAEVDGIGRPREMYVLNPSRMSIVPDRRDFIRGYVYSVNGVNIPFRREDIIHIKYAHPQNDFYGLSPLTAARLAIDVDAAAAEWNRTFLLRGGWPVGALQTETEVDEKTERRIKRELKQTVMRGKDSSGMILLLSGGLKYESLQVSPKDMDWISARQLSRDEILAIYGVPFAVAGLFSTEQTTARSAGVIQQVKNFYLFTMFPKMQKLLGGLNLGLAPRFADRFELRIDRRGVPALQDDVEQEKTRAETYRTLVGSGWSPNSALAELYPHVQPFDWGDVAWMNSSLVPISGPENPTLDSTPADSPPSEAPPPGNAGFEGLLRDGGPLARLRAHKKAR